MNIRKFAVPHIARPIGLRLMIELGLPKSARCAAVCSINLPIALRKRGVGIRTGHEKRAAQASRSFLFAHAKRAYSPQGCRRPS